MRRHVPVNGHKGIYWSDSKTHGKVYEIRYTDSSGRNVTKTIGPKLQDALNAQADIRVRLGKGERIIGTSKMFSEVVREWEAHRFGAGTKLSPGTIRSYKGHLKNHIMPEFENQKVGKITADMIYLWLRDIPLSGSTRNTIYTILRDILGFAANRRRGYISHNPCNDLDKTETPKADLYPVRILKPEETGALLEACPDWLRPIVQTALLSGLRVGEILGLTWDDIDFAEDVIHVRGQRFRHGKVPTKNGKHRDVILLPALRAILFAQPTRFRGGYVFQNRNGDGMIYDKIQAGFSKARKDAGLTDTPRTIRFHDLRHTFASALLRDGRDVTWVAELLGHSNATITLTTYAHVINRQDRKEEASMRLSEALGGWAGGGA